MASEEAKVTSFYCQPCGRKISSEAAYKSHLVSAKHKQQILRYQEHADRNAMGVAEKEDNSSVTDTVSCTSSHGLAAESMDTGMCIVIITI